MCTSWRYALLRWALLNNGMILRVGALSNGRVNRPWVAPVEWASCQFQCLDAIASGGNPQDRVELASCQFHAYFRAGKMPTPLIFILRLSNTQNIHEKREFIG